LTKHGAADEDQRHRQHRQRSKKGKHNSLHHHSVSTGGYSSNGAFINRSAPNLLCRRPRTIGRTGSKVLTDPPEQTNGVDPGGVECQIVARLKPYLRRRPYNCVREMPSVRAASAMFQPISRMTRSIVERSTFSGSVVWPPRYSDSVTEAAERHHGTSHPVLGS